MAFYATTITAHDVAFLFRQRRLRNRWVKADTVARQPCDYRTAGRATQIIDGTGEALLMLVADKIAASDMLRPHREHILQHATAHQSRAAWVLRVSDQQIVDELRLHSVTQGATP